MKYREYMNACKATYLAALMAKHQGCVKLAAREAGCNRTAFYEMLQRFGLETYGQSRRVDRAQPQRGHRGNEHWQSMHQ